MRTSTFEVASSAAELAETFDQGFDAGSLLLGAGSAPKHADAIDLFWLLSARRKRPSQRRATNNLDEITPFHCLCLPPTSPASRRYPGQSRPGNRGRAVHSSRKVAGRDAP